MVRKSFSLLSVAAMFATACSSPAQLTSHVAEAAGANCEHGGLAISSGMDEDGDGALGASEIDSTEYLCNGAPGVAGTDGTDGTNHLIDVTEEPEGENCPTGGSRINVGPDTNGNGELDEDEVTNTAYDCNTETPTKGNTLLRSEYVGEADADCAGGYLVHHYGVDADGDAVLSEEEATASLRSCNAVPMIAAMPTHMAESCEADIVVTAEASDSDGSIASYSWEVVASGSELTLSGTDTASVTIAAGAHVAGAILSLTVTDNYGAEAQSNFIVAFAGTGCTQISNFYGIQPDACTVVDVERTAGDDRGGPIVTHRYAYYNGDDALVRTDLALGAVQTVGGRDFDILFAERSTGKLYALWNSEWQGGVAERTTQDTNSSNDLGFDQIVELSEETLMPVRAITLDRAIAFDDYTREDEIRYNNHEHLLAATGGFLVQGEVTWTTDRNVLTFRRINLTDGTSTVLLDGSRPSNGATQEQNDLYNSLRWARQETRVSNYGIFGDAENGMTLSYKRRDNGNWVNLNLSDGSIAVGSETFADNCDVQQLQIDAAGLFAYFHDEGSCFGAPEGGWSDETIYRCMVQFGPNDGNIDDRGSN